MNRSPSERKPGSELGTIVVAADANELARKKAITQDVGVLLIVSGVAGILLPGAVGTPLLVLGCVMIWPKAFEGIERFVARRFPRTHHLGALQSARFLDDLERRYPISR